MKIVSFFAGCLLVTCSLAAQQPGAATGSDKPPVRRTAESRRFVFTLSEMDQGRRLNNRSFEMLCSEDSQCVIKSGSRVPVGTSSASVQYVDVGLNARVQFSLQEAGRVQLTSDIDMSDVASETQSNLQPVIRQTRYQLQALVGPEGETTLGMIQDLHSGHTYEVRVAVKSR